MKQERFFFSGRHAEDTYLGYARRCDLTPCVLYSFAEVYSDTRVAYEIEPMIAGGVRLMLDSGAYSVFTGTLTANREEHVKFASRHAHHFCSIAALDVINNPEASWENYVWQRARLDVFPVFHLGEPWELFDAYVASCPPMIGIGGVAGDKAKGPATMAGLHTAFSRLCDPGHGPRLPVHGFAMGLGHVTKTFPWTTADSATAVRASGGGRLMQYRNGGMVNIMVRADDLFINDRRITSEEREDLSASLRAHGTTLRDVIEFSAPRTAINIMEMRRLAYDIPSIYTPPATTSALF